MKYLADVAGIFPPCGGILQIGKSFLNRVIVPILFHIVKDDGCQHLRIICHGCGDAAGFKRMKDSGDFSGVLWLCGKVRHHICAPYYWEASNDFLEGLWDLKRSP